MPLTRFLNELVFHVRWPRVCSGAWYGAHGRPDVRGPRIEDGQGEEICEAETSVETTLSAFSTDFLIMHIETPYPNQFVAEHDMEFKCIIIFKIKEIDDFRDVDL